MFKAIKNRICQSNAATVIQEQLDLQVQNDLFQEQYLASIQPNEIVRSVWKQNEFLLAGGFGDRPDKESIAVFCLASMAVESQEQPEVEKLYMSILFTLLNKMTEEAKVSGLTQVDLQTLEASVEIIEPLMHRYGDFSARRDLSQFTTPVSQ